MRTLLVSILLLGALGAARTAAACTNDINCTTDPACGGSVCSWNVAGHACVAAGTDPGWCQVDSDCKCFALGAKCGSPAGGNYCTFTVPPADMNAPPDLAGPPTLDMSKPGDAGTGDAATPTGDLATAPTGDGGSPAKDMATTAPAADMAVAAAGGGGSCAFGTSGPLGSWPILVVLGVIGLALLRLRRRPS